MSNLPESITDAIDAYGRARSNAAWNEASAFPQLGFVDESGETRAALEAAIAEDTLRQVHAELLCAASQPDVLAYLNERMREVRGPNPKPVEPPTDAEVEAWEKHAKRMECSCAMDYSVTREEIAEAVALMRRARATEAAIDEAIGDRGVSERDCRLPIAERVSNIISELKEWRHDYGEAALKLELKLERLRERVHEEADNACKPYSDGLWRAVELIDEERRAIHGG